MRQNDACPLRDSRVLPRNNHLQSIPRNAELHRGLAHVLSIGIDIERISGFKSRSFGLCVLDLAKAEMPTEINRGKQTEEFERVHRAHYADVQFAVVEPRLRSDLHAAAVGWSVGEGGENGGRCRGVFV